MQNDSQRGDVLEENKENDVQSNIEKTVEDEKSESLTIY